MRGAGRCDYALAIRYTRVKGAERHALGIRDPIRTRDGHVLTELFDVYVSWTRDCLLALGLDSVMV